MKKLSIVLIPLLILTLAGILIGCDTAEEIKDNIQDKIDGKDTTSDGAIPMTSDFWLKVNTGNWEETSEGIKVYGAGYRAGHQGIQSKANYDFTDSETFIKWKANGGANREYGAFWVFLMSDYDPETAETSGLARGGFFTTDHQWKDSVVINHDTWYYTRIKVNSDGSYTTATATGNYDSNGGTSIYTGDGTYQNAENGKIVVVFQDNYGGTTTFQVVGEARTTKNAAGTVTKPTPTVAAGEKSVLVWVCDGITNATFNGQPVPAGQESRVTIKLNQPLQAEFDFTDPNRNNPHATITLDSYYDFFVLKSNGGWAQSKYQSGYDTDKSSCPAVTQTPTATPTPTPTPTATPTGDTSSCVFVTDPILAAHGSTGVFFSNTVTLNIPENFVSVVMSQNCEGNLPIGIDDEASVTVTLPSGTQQTGKINQNGALSAPQGEQWILSNVIDFKPGVNQIKVDLVNVYAPSGTNYASSTIYIVALPTEPSPIVSITTPSTTTGLGRFPSALAFDGTDIWVTTQGNNSLNKLRGTDGALLATYNVCHDPTDVLYDGANLWVTNRDDNTVVKISPSSGTLLGTYPVGDYPVALAFDGANIWVANQKGASITKLRASDGNVLLTYDLPGSGQVPKELAFDGTSLWVGCHWGSLFIFNTDNPGFNFRSHSTGGYISGLACDGESVRTVIWHDGGANPEVRKYASPGWLWLGDYQLPNIDLPSALTYDGSSFWVADSNQNKVVKLPANYFTYPDMQNYSYPEEEITYTTGDGPMDMVYGAGAMWVANNRDSSVTRIPAR